MPLKKGHSPEVVSHNIKEMMKSGYKQKQAIAASLASARKYKKMAEGGMVEPFEERVERGPEDNERSLYQLMEEADSHPSEVSNPEELSEEVGFAKALQRKHDSEMSTENYAMGGLVEGEHDTPVGNKPDEDMHSETEEPMSSEPNKPDGLEHSMIEGVPMSKALSQEAMDALEKHKKKRRFMAR